MKKIILSIFCLGMLFPLLGSAARPYGVEEIPNVQIGDRYRFTSNPDGILSSSAVAEIDSLCYSLRHRALAQVAVVAVEDIRGDDLFSFAHTLFSQWGVGRADSDNGLGILLVVDRREVRFVTGPGLEGVLPDALCKRIQMRYMLPYFREGDYSAGMVAGLRAVASVLEGSELDSAVTTISGLRTICRCGRFSWSSFWSSSCRWASCWSDSTVPGVVPGVVLSHWCCNRGISSGRRTITTCSKTLTVAANAVSS